MTTSAATTRTKPQKSPQGRRIGVPQESPFVGAVHWKTINPNPKTRIDTHKEKPYKLEQTILYILGKSGGKRITEGFLQKLLYFIDFDYYEKFETQLIGAKYIKTPNGPVLAMFAAMIKIWMKGSIITPEKNEARRNGKTPISIVPTHKENFSVLTKREIEHINEELERFRGWTDKQLSALLHVDTPWLVAEKNKVLEYEYVFYRPDKTAVREYEEL